MRRYEQITISISLIMLMLALHGDDRATADIIDSLIKALANGLID